MRSRKRRETTLKRGSLIEEQNNKKMTSSRTKTEVELGDLIHIYILIVKVTLLLKILANKIKEHLCEVPTLKK